MPVLDIETFLRDRPAAAIPGVGRKRTIVTDVHDWNTAWDFASAPPSQIKTLFGKTGDELRRELEKSKADLAARKVVEKAKGILMKAKNLTEETAYSMLRKTAMNENKKIAEVAQSMITAAELFR